MDLPHGCAGVRVQYEIRHETSTKGFFNPIVFYEVWVSVTFTQAELDIVEATNITDYPIAERRPHPASEQWDDNEPLKLRDLIENETDGYAFASFPVAKVYEQKVIEGLSRIKQLIEVNTDPVLTIRGDL